MTILRTIDLKKGNGKMAKRAKKKKTNALNFEMETIELSKNAVCLKL